MCNVLRMLSLYSSSCVWSTILYEPLYDRLSLDIVVRPVARTFRTGVTWMSDVYVCMHKHARLGGSGGMLPHENKML